MNFTFPNGNKETTFLGRTNFRGSDRVFGMKKRDRRQHTYVVGMTGTGKTTLLENMVLQDVRAGNGLAIVDPHGEFVERILKQIPVERTNDVIYFNPVDSEYPIGFNVLEIPDLQYKHLIISDLLGIFTKIWAGVWSARMEYILQNCIAALIDTPGTTLLGIPRILVDKGYREKILANVKDPVVRSFWLQEYETWRDQFRAEAIVPVQNKVGQFLNTSFVRNIVGQSKSGLRIPEIMNEKKILLCNVSKGKIGEDNSQLLGAMIITKIQLAAMERIRIPEEERQDFYLYVDEFQNFATDSFASILSEARKYRLNLIIAHQYIGQLVSDMSTKVRDAVFGNCGTMMNFRVGATDAEFLEKEYAPELTMQDLIGLPNHSIYLKLMVDGVTSRPFSASTLPRLELDGEMVSEENIIRASREHYATPRAEVENTISRWSGMLPDEEGGTMAQTMRPGEKFETPCWHCGKKATPPFKPDGKRPVYCKDCQNKIAEGKIIPIAERMPKVREAKFQDSLQNLGIEFKAQTDRTLPPRGPAPQSLSQLQTPKPPSRPEPPRPQRISPPTPVRSEARPEHRPPPHRPNPPRSGTSEPGFNRDQPPREHTPQHPQAPPPAANFISKPIVRSSVNSKPVSLSQLKPRDEHRKEEKKPEHPPEPKPVHKPTAPDVAGLREILKNVLKENLETKIPPEQKTPATVPEPQQPAPPPPPPPQPKEEKSEFQFLKPGETIKL